MRALWLTGSRSFPLKLRPHGISTRQIWRQLLSSTVIARPLSMHGAFSGINALHFQVCSGRGITRAVGLRRRMSTAELPEHKEVYMPKLSPTMEVGTVAEWVKKEGDHIEAGDVIAEIETDKTSRSYEWNDEGYMARILVEENQPDVPVGKIMCVIVEDEADLPAFKDYVPPDAAPMAVAEPVKVAEEKKEPPKEKAPVEPGLKRPAVPSPAPVVAEGAERDRVRASPLARVKAAAEGIALDELEGTGPGGRITAADVEQAVAEGPRDVKDVSPVEPPAVSDAARTGLAAYADFTVSKYKRVTAQRLLLSKQTIPHYYMNAECVVDEMLRIRSSINKKAKNGEYKLSVNDFVVKAAAAALRKVPEVNAQWMESAIRMFHDVDICVAVQTNNGLITPIIQDADRKGLREISETVKSLAAKARDNALEPEEYMGGTFTISNLGMYGTDQFSAIVNPPQAAILAVGTSQKRVVPDETSDSGIKVASVMNVSLSCDHRVIDGAVGAQWLATFKQCIEDPIQIIV